MIRDDKRHGTLRSLILASAIVALAACGGSSGSGSGETCVCANFVNDQPTAPNDSEASCSALATSLNCSGSEIIDDDAGCDGLRAPCCAVRACSSVCDCPPVENPFLSDRVLNIAHRGGREAAPEATLEAFRSAVAIGVDVLEMDVRGTADGGVVVIHDQTVNRTTDGTGRVEDLTLAEIRSLDAGYRFTRDGGQTYPFRGTGVRVPTLDEVLTEFSDQFMLIEIKVEGPPIFQLVADLLQQRGMSDRVIIASFDDAIIQQFRAAAPGVLTAFSLVEAVEFYALTPEAEESYQPPAEFLQVPPSFQGIEVLTPDFIARSRRFGLKIHVWDVYGAQQMNEIIDLGVAGLIVDEPETLERILEERGLAQ
jgi:glycerophosphoryl diester phosphodiesterase